MPEKIFKKFERISKRVETFLASLLFLHALVIEEVYPRYMISAFIITGVMMSFLKILMITIIENNS